MILENTIAHPCFDIAAKHTHARIHLPVAPKCNIQCNYCNRKFDCVNESRPGVSSTILSPEQALAYVKEMDKKISNLSVVGIAGPGDPFANAKETIETMRMIKNEFPNKLFCISTNGLNIKPYIHELTDIGVTHVTLTINGTNPAILSKIYAWVRDNKKMYYGEEAALLLMSRQMECISLLKEKNITVKINTVIIPGINDTHIAEVARQVKAEGADLMNCIPLYPNQGTLFENIKEPSIDLVNVIRNEAGVYLPMMTHCSRCRADAAGLLGKDEKISQEQLQSFALAPKNFHTESRPYVAVASQEGLLVNMHLGKARKFYIFKKTDDGFRLVEIRNAPPSGTGDFRWIRLTGILKDCRGILVEGIGPNPRSILQQSGIKVIQMSGLIDEGLETIYNNKEVLISPHKIKPESKCGGKSDCCSGN